MAYQSLYRTYRPQTFSQMVGQDAIVRALKNQAARQRVAHAYLFCGSRGTGKTSAARIMAMAINCEQSNQGDPCLVCSSCKALAGETTLDVFEMDAASNSRVEEIREMLARTDYPPQFVRYKVYIIDEVHMLSNAAFNALLKTLEEPPPYMVFILATTEPQKLPATILSRCQRFDFGRIPEADIAARLKLALSEDLQADEGALQLIAATAQGSMRDAWSLMDMCLGMDPELTEEKVRHALGAVSQEFLYDFLDALIKGDTGAALGLADQLMRAGRDVQVSLREFSAHLRQVLAFKWTGKGITDTTAEQAARLNAQAQAASASLLLFILEKSMQAEQDARWSVSPRAVLELFVLRSTQLQQEGNTSAVITRLSQVEHQLSRMAEGQPAAPVKREAVPAIQPADPVPVQKKAAAEPAVMAPEPAVRPEDIAAFSRQLPEEASAPPAAPAQPEKEETKEPDTVAGMASEEPVAPAAPEGLPLNLDAAPSAPQPLAKTPKDAWNNMLKRLARENEGLYAMLHRGKYGGFLNDVFTLLLDKEDDILSSLLNEDSRSGPINRILTEEMGKPVRFSAGEPRPQVAHARSEAQDEQLEALAQMFGRDKINLKRDS